MAWRSRRMFRRRRGVRKRPMRRKSFLRRRLRKFHRRAIYYQPHPKNLLRHYRYATTIVLDLTNAQHLTGFAQYVFRANGTYDPDSTGTGHYCPGFFEDSKFWRNYVVHRSKIRCHYMLQGEDEPAWPIYVGLLKESHQHQWIDCKDIIENKVGQYRLTSTSEGGHRPVKCYMTYNAKKDWGVTNVNDNKEELGSIINNVPTKQMYFTVWANSITIPPLGSTYKVFVTVTIDYWVKLSDRNPEFLPRDTQPPIQDPNNE